MSKTTAAFESAGRRHDLPGADEAAFTLAALKDWTFLFGPDLPPSANADFAGDPNAGLETWSSDFALAAGGQDDDV